MQAHNAFFSISFIVAYFHVCLPMRTRPSGLQLVQEFDFRTPASRLASVDPPWSPSEFGGIRLSSLDSPRGIFPVSPTQEFNPPGKLKNGLEEYREFQASKLDQEVVTRAFHEQSGQRLIVLDYDGTLRDFVIDPNAATPSEELLENLRFLASYPQCSVWIVSGRDQAFLQRHFGKIENLGLKAEYGGATKAPGSSEWKPLPFDKKVLEEISDILNRKQTSVPESSLESKGYGIAYHYRKPWLEEREIYEALQKDLDALRKKGTSSEGLDQFIRDKKLSFVAGPSEKSSGNEEAFYSDLEEKLKSIDEKYEAAARDLKRELEQVILTRNLPLGVNIGKKVVEVKSNKLNKRNALEDIYSKMRLPNYVLVAGDESPDELMFAVAREMADKSRAKTLELTRPSLFTIHVSHGKELQTLAEFKVKKPEDVIALLTAIRNDRAQPARLRSATQLMPI